MSALTITVSNARADSARATGRWDYAKNDGPHDLKIGSEVTVRVPEEAKTASRTASEKLLKEVGRLCFSWLVVNKMTMGSGTA